MKDEFESLESGHDLQTGVSIQLGKLPDGGYEIRIQVGSDKAAAYRWLQKIEPHINGPIDAGTECTSCDGAGCGFCVPCEPHGQPTE